MRLPKSDLHLGYCSNIHPGEEWPEVFDRLKTNLPELKRRLAPEQAFGIGLRLSAAAARTLLDERAMKTFRDWLEREDFYVFTINGFPYGSFHGRRIKDRVYQPDWSTAERLRYSRDLAKVLERLLKAGEEGGISTSPVSYKAWLTDEASRREVLRESSRNMARVALQMHRIRDESGVSLHLDIEPEPDCLIENTEETISFFNDWLLRDGVEFLIQKNGLTASQSEAIIRKHLRVCYDTCHFAVEYEEPEYALQRFAAEGIRIGKMQVSAALKALLPAPDQREGIRNSLREFAEHTYLHQVIERREDDSLHHYPDLPDALHQIGNPAAREWRIHYHVPVFLEQFEELRSTRDTIIRSLAYLRKERCCRHVEVETYTWDVLPAAMKTDLLTSIERELWWTMGHLRSVGHA